jgi:hypothetical protein
MARYRPRRGLCCRDVFFAGAGRFVLSFAGPRDGVVFGLGLRSALRPMPLNRLMAAAFRCGSPARLGGCAASIVE